MRRIFTLLSISTFLFSMQSAGQNCATTQPNPAICSQVAENFNVTDAGFTSTPSDFSYNQSSFARTIAGATTTSSSTITSHTYTKNSTNPGLIQTGFQFTGGKISITSIKVDILDASTGLVIATCTQTYATPIAGTNTPQTICIGVFSNAITEGLSVKIRFTINTTNTGGGNGGHTFTFDNFSVGGGNGSQATLPVKFVSLSAKQSAAGTLLTWKVAEEEGVASYEVEKGTNGKNFSKIGSVPASKISTYTFTDGSSAPVSFYRVKSVDLDGKFGYSTIISLKNGKTIATMKAFPMPAQRQITVQHSMTSNNAKLLISTGDGRLVKSVIPAVGSMQTEVDLSTFKAGLYLLSFEDGNGTKETMKFIKN